MIVLAVLSGGCTESLPPREDPTGLFDGHTVAEYIVSNQKNVVLLRFVVVNTYDEVLEGTTSISGSMSLSLVRDAAVTRTFDLDSRNIQYASDFDPTSGYLRVPPGDSVVFTSEYNFINDDGTTLANVVPYMTDPDCADRLVTVREVFAVRASVDIFRRVRTVTAPLILFDLCAVSTYVIPNYCAPITGLTSACSN